MDSQYNVESTQETKTTTSSSSDVGLDKIYMKSIDSILKIAEMVLSLIIFICVTSHPGYVYIGGGWVQFVSISCLITVLLLWIFFMLRIIYKLPGPWQLIILIYTIVIVLLLVTSFLVCAIRAVCYDYFGDWNAGLLAGAGSYGFQILIYYIVYLVFYLISFLVCAIQAGNIHSSWNAGLIAGAILIYYIVYLVFYLISFLVCAIQAGNYAQTGGLIAGAILVYYVAFSVLYLITTIVCIGQSNKMASNGGLIAAAVFCFFILLVMGADTFFQFRKYQESGSGLGTRTVTGGTTTTTTHTTYETRTQY